MSAPLTWVVGGGGLLGRQVAGALPGPHWSPAAPIPWADEGAAGAAIDAELERLLAAAAARAAPWRLMWCAGAGVVATPPEALAAETRLLTRVIGRLAARLERDPGLARAGTAFLASSGGGVYAGSPAPPPYDELSPTGAMAPYGREKLAHEALFMELGERCGVDVLVARLSNLYGPGQSLHKPQGLISHVGRAALRREPISIYVPLDTIRDYLLAEDAGRMVAGAVERIEHERRARGGSARVVRVVASEVDTTVASVLGAWRQALRRPLRVAFGSSPAGRLQPRVLSFRSRVWPDLRGCPTLLPLGIDAVRRDQLARLLAAGLR